MKSNHIYSHKIKERYTLLFTFILFLVTFFLNGCNTDLHLNNYYEDSESNLIIRIPSNNEIHFNSTRADNAPYTNEESIINNLYLIAIPENIENANPIRTIALTDNKLKPNQSSNYYKEYSVNLFPGNYKFYVFANLDRYITDDNIYTSLQNLKFETENDITDIILYFQSDIPIETGHIPMGCLPEKMRFGDSGNTSGWNGGFTNISSESTSFLTADLNFLCSKIRYTILFDNTPLTGISKEFGNRKIAFYNEGNYATNIRKQSGLITNNSKVSGEFILDNNNTASYWMLNLDRFIYPEEGINYPTNPSKTLTKWPENEDWETSGKRAWQGVIYLPENNNTGIGYSKLIFNYSIDGRVGNEPKEIELIKNNSQDHGIERGKMYDVVALVKDPGEIELETYVTISPWETTDLDYQLNGKMEAGELTVETSQITINPNEKSMKYWFKSDKNVSAESQKILIGDKQVDLFDINVDNESGYFSIEINTELNPDSSLPSNPYFYLYSGSLRKRIDVSIEGWGNFAFIDFDDNITIDAAELIGKLHYNGHYDLDFRTNSDLTISLTAVNREMVVLNDCLKIFVKPVKISEDGYIADGEFREIEFNGSNNETILSGIREGVIRIAFSGLSSGNDFWKTEQLLLLSLKGETITKEIPIIIKPFNTDFTPDEGTVTDPDTGGNTDEPEGWFHKYDKIVINWPASVKSSYGNSDIRGLYVYYYGEDNNENKPFGEWEPEPRGETKAFEMKSSSECINIAIYDPYYFITIPITYLIFKITPEEVNWDTVVINNNNIGLDNKQVFNINDFINKIEKNDKTYTITLLEKAF